MLCVFTKGVTATRQRGCHDYYSTWKRNHQSGGRDFPAWCFYPDSKVLSCEIWALLQQEDGQPQCADGEAVDSEPPEFSCDAQKREELERGVADNGSQHHCHQQADGLAATGELAEVPEFEKHRATDDGKGHQEGEVEGFAAAHAQPGSGGVGAAGTADAREHRKGLGDADAECLKEVRRGAGCRAFGLPAQ